MWKQNFTLKKIKLGWNVSYQVKWVCIEENVEENGKKMLKIHEKYLQQYRVVYKQFGWGIFLIIWSACVNPLLKWNVSNDVGNDALSKQIFHESNGLTLTRAAQNSFYIMFLFRISVMFSLSFSSDLNFSVSLGVNRKIHFTKLNESMK